MTEEEVSSRVHDAFACDEVRVQDLKGDGRSFRVEVKSSIFEGKSLLAQHKLVQDIFAQDLARDIIHALSLKTTSG